ncbi:MAG TPA: glycosyltransferase [Phycisphaerae bacterium]|nr:glycosyltransferase [Phycisphaerae bacterium]HRW52247.1 glycosyltransferase [Phycisphaerae bacterium]
MKILMLLPAFNEEDSIPALLPRIRDAMETGGFDYRVVLVDDGSRDETAARAERFRREMPIDILRHPINRGLGETIRDGIEHCVGIGGPGDIVVRMDCDDSQDPAYVATLVEKVQSGCDVVVTSRYQPGGGQSGVEGHRKLLSWGAGLYMKLLFPIRGLRDYSCGYRAYRWETLKRAIDVYGNRFIERKDLGFSCTLEKVVKLDLLGARFGEVAHYLHYDRKKSVSKMASLPTTWGYLLLAMKYSKWFGVRRGYWKRRIAEFRDPRVSASPQEERPVSCAASQAA